MTRKLGSFRPSSSSAAFHNFNAGADDDRSVSIGVRDVAKTKLFYDAALKPLGYTCLSEGEGSLGYGRDSVALWISSAEHPVPADVKSGLHFCFTAPTARSVDAFYAAA